MTTSFPAARIAMTEDAGAPIAALLRFQRAIDLDPALHALISVRASQLNGCAFCVDMHWKDARAAGESEQRLYALDAWRESPWYSDRERAALELCEAITFVSAGHVADDVWARAAAAFESKELAHLVFAVVAINSWNRLCITARVEPGHYQPGDFAAQAA